MKIFNFFLFVLFSFGTFAQTSLTKITPQLKDVLNSANSTQEQLVWVFFNDKGDNIESFYADPVSVVSQKSLDRRKKVLPADALIKNSDLPVNPGYIVQVEHFGFNLKQKSRWFNGISGYATKSEIGLIAQLPIVKSLDIVYKFKRDYPVEDDESSDIKTDELNKPNGINSFDYGPSFTQVNQINVPAVHDLGFYGQGITICSMDAGFNNLAHEVFDSMNIIAKWDFVDGDPDVSQGGSHGTETLSTIGGFKEGELIGPAFGSDFILARTEDIYSETPVEEDNWIAALEWADSIGVDVTTTSLGYLDFDPPFQSYTWQDMDGNTARITIAADLAVGLGIVVVNSAGNAGYNPNHNTLGAPADGDSVIAVGAVTASGQRSSFSSVGPTVDGRIKPDLMAMGSSVFVASPYNTHEYTLSSGTSFSCPLLAGAAALILSVDHSLTPMEVLNLLRQTASKSNNPDNLMGWGIINTLDAINLIPVPVELTMFRGDYIKGKVKLEWSTATETNNYGFEVQKRYKNTSFAKIGFVAGNGTTANRINYSFTDKNIQAGKIFYRLKQLDFNGDFEYSNEILVDASVLNDFQLYQNYPNPFNPSTVIKYSVPEQSRIKISLYDIIGNEIKSLYDGVQQAGLYQITLNAEDLPSGIYFVSMRADNFSKAIKITLLK